MAGAVADKILEPLAGRPVFAHAAAAFVASGVADLYVVVYRDPAQMRRLSAWAPTPALLVPGGAERSDSVMNALAALPTDIETVFIHDCARPLIRPEQLTVLAKRARRAPALVLAHRVTDTIKELAGRKLRTLDRRRLWAMETPQVFSRQLITRAYARVARRGVAVTDDAAAVELLGQAITLEENPHPNPKLTTPADFAYVEFLLAREAAAADISPS
jgi:2-C-methyl-D-erythritol 4-phosphate cytidylyltransferase